jgi:hypothetical protein
MIIAIFFEAIGNIFLSRYILRATLTKTLDFQKIVCIEDVDRGYIAVGSTLVNFMDDLNLFYRCAALC